MTISDTILSSARPRILVVDDTPTHLQLLRHALQERYQVFTAEDGAAALRWIELNGPPDLILLDILMPDFDGYEVCRRLKADPATRDVPVIFLTALGETRDEVKGFEVGAVDFIVKPAPAAVVLARVSAHVALRRTQLLLANANREIENEMAIFEAGIWGLISFVQVMGKDSRPRLKRIQRYVERLLKDLRQHAARWYALEQLAVERMVRACVLYDVGKLAIPPSILDKPDVLSPEEKAILRTHAELGGQALQAWIDEISAHSGCVANEEQPEYRGPVAVLAYARDMAMHHHERWDGSGYPLRLAGEDIPLGARVLSVAETYDELLSRRPYKSPWPREKVTDFIVSRSGTRFDPTVVAAFRRVEPVLFEVWQGGTDVTERT